MATLSIQHALILFLLVKPAFGAWSTTDVMAIRTSTVSAAANHKLVRPSEKVTVGVSMSLLTINSLDLKSQIASLTGWLSLELKTQELSVTGWLNVEWTDSRLTWNSATYPDVPHVFALDTEIWKPELFVDNALDDVTILSDSALLFKIEVTGKVVWELPRIFVVHCDVDITYYPFDSQTCVIELTSWGYTKEEIELSALKTTVNTDSLKENGEWEVTKSSVVLKELTETTSSGATETYSQLDFFITLKRKPAYYITGLLLPILLTSFLNTMVFILPVDSGEKVGFILTVLLALAVLLTLITDSIPSTSLNISILSSYLASTLCISVVCCLLTVIVIRLYFMDEGKPVPKSLKKVLDKVIVPFSCWNSCWKCVCCKKGANSKKSQVTPNGNGQVNMRDSGFLTNEKDVDGMEKNSDINRHDEETIYSWQEVSKIVDFFFFILMFIITTISTLAFMLALSIGGAVNAGSGAHTHA